MEANSQGTGSGNIPGGSKPTLTWTQPPKPPAGGASKPASTPKTPGEKQTTGAYVGVFVGGLVIGALLGWGITQLHSGSMPSDMSGTQGMTNSTSSAMQNTTQTETGTSNVNLSSAMLGGALVINSPQPAGLTVSVAHISVSQPTWVVVYEDHGGALGNALGAALFNPASQGGAESGTIDLLRGTTPGETYLIGEALDDGDHQFSLQTDLPVRDQSGNPVLGQFQTQ